MIRFRYIYRLLIDLAATDIWDYEYINLTEYLDLIEIVQTSLKYTVIKTPH